MDTKLSVLDRFNSRVEEIAEKLSLMKKFAYSISDSNKTKDKYLKNIEATELPTNPSIVGGILTYSIYGEQRTISTRNIKFMGFCKDRAMRATIVNLSALMSGKKQAAVNAVAIMRRESDGTYRGSDKTTQVKREMGINGRIAQKVANARRMPDGSYKGIDKMLKTKRDNGINTIAAYKTANTRRMPDGSFKGAYKTSQTRRQRGYLSTKYGAPCIYQHRDGYWLVMRSMWEWAYACWLDSEELSWSYESTVLYTGGKSHIPDFTINGDEHHEIKPKRMVDERLGQEYISQHNIRVVTEEDFDFKTYRSQAERYRLDGANSFRKDFRLQGSI